MIIQHNMAALNMMTQLGVTNDKLKKAAERLSSGYRVNRAADDAAAMAISEKKRAQIRGLARASKNAQDGISFVQTGDGAMSQIGAMLHRMRELTVQALNDGVYEPADRAALQMEFDQLQGEIDRVNDQTEFNKKPVFEHYTDNFSLLEGNRVWSQDQIHTIDSSNSSLTVKYIVVEPDGTEVEKEKTLTIPEGTYTTRELMDEMDDVVTALGDEADGLYLEYSDDHKCNMVLQNGKEVKDVSGGLSYLFYDCYGGNKSGALIGTTVFFPGDPLVVKDGENDELHFRIEYYDGTMKEIDIDVAEDGYTRNDMIKYLNEYRFPDGKTLIDYGIKASEYGDASIQIGGDTGLITGLKGNMFAIDDKHFDSVFYDNTKYGTAKEVPAVFTGGNVLNASDVNFSKFDIDNTNNTLRLRVDGGTYETIQLDAGSYNITEMVAQLQKKLDEKNLGIKVTQHTVSGVTTPNGNKSYRFSGLTLTTNSIGKESSIEFDVPGSSAYDTLFVQRRYTDPGKDSNIVDGEWYTTNSAPYLMGGKVFDSTVDFPLTIDGSNKSFYLEVTEEGETPKKPLITLTEKTYSSLDQIIKEINDRIGDQTNYAGKIQAVRSSSRIELTTKPGNDTVTKINVSGGVTSGYDVLFVGETVTYPRGTSITLLPIKPDASGNITLTSLNNKLNVSIGGEYRTVTIAPGTYTPEKLVELLNESELKGKPVTSYNTYSSSTNSGKTVYKTNSATTESGKESPCTNSGAAGTGGKVDGSTQVKDGTSGWHQLGGTLGSYTKIDNSNNQFSIDINGKKYTVTLKNSTGSGYTASGLAKEIENRLKEVTSEANQVKVSVNSGHLRFTTVAVGEGKTVTTAGCDSPFLASVNTNKTKGYTTTSSIYSNTYPITLNSSNNQFTIKIDGKAETVSLDTTKTYNNLSDIQKELNDKLSVKGVTVSIHGSGLRFERDTPGSGSVSLDIDNSGTAGGIIFKAPATATMYQSSVTIPKATNATTPGTAKFTVTVGGNTYTATLTNTDTSNAKTFTADQLQAELNKAVWKQNDSGTAKTPGDFGFSISSSGGNVKFATTERGSGQSISASAKAGPVNGVTPTVKASLTKNPDGTISIGLNSTSEFAAIPYNKIAVLQAEGDDPERSDPYYTTRKYTTKKCNLTTKRPNVMPDSVTITDANKTLRFSYRYHYGSTKNIEITLDKGTYSRTELQKMLQEKLDASLENDPAHKGEGLKVEVGDQIILESKRHGRYEIYGINGGFYENVMMGTALRTENDKAAYIEGKLVVDDVYIVGRKDIRNKNTTILKGDNDELNVDLTINGKVTTLNMVLDPGTYNSDSLVKHIQEKLSEQLKANGLPEDMVLAGVGVYDSGAEGADDKNALFFYLNKNLELTPGDYAIDGLSGKALFSIFYKTDGDPIPAYVTGTKDISGGVEVKDGENEFSIDVDGKTYTYKIPEGSYDTAEELVDALNKVITDAADDSCLKVSLSGNMLKFAYNKLGVHTIENIQGPAKTALFYQTMGRFDQEVDGWLQIGANGQQGVELKRYSMSTMSLGVNSLSVSKHKYADKALERIDEALNYLSSVRSKYGALENRLEYAVRVDDIAAENTQNSESIDRDADMASEMVEYSKSKILQQAGVSILSQTNRNTQSILSLLK